MNLNVKGKSTHQVEGETIHSVQGQVTTRNEIVFTVDTSGCGQVPVEQRLECIQTLVKYLSELKNVAEILYCSGINQAASGPQGANPFVTCRGLGPVGTKPTGT